VHNQNVNNEYQTYIDDTVIYNERCNNDDGSPFRNSNNGKNVLSLVPISPVEPSQSVAHLGSTPSNVIA